MGIEQSSGTDTRVEGTDKPPGQDRPPAPPPDRPGQPGYPSRLESLRAAREAQLARAAEMESRQPASPDNGTEQSDDREGEGPESSRDEQQETGEIETAVERRESKAENGEPVGEPDAEQPEGAQVGETEVTTKDSAPLAESLVAEDIDSSSAERRNAQGEAEDASRSAPEGSDEPRPDDAEEQAGTADTDEGAGEPNGEALGGGQADAPAEPDEPSPTGQTVEGDGQRSADGRFAATEMPEQSDVLGNSASSPRAAEEGGAHQASPAQTGESGFGSQTKSRDGGSDALSEIPVTAAGGSSEIERQVNLGGELAQLAEKKVDLEIDQTLAKVNPKFDRTRSDYSENCTGVVQANELRRRGHDVEAGPLEKHLRSDQNGPGGRDLSDIEQAWGGTFTSGTKAEIEEAFKQPGSRGIVYIAWNGVNTGAHVFSVENVGGRVRFVDSQPKPPVRDAAYYFTVGHSTKYLRVDDLPTPPSNKTDPFLEP